MRFVNVVAGCALAAGLAACTSHTTGRPPIVSSSPSTTAVATTTGSSPVSSTPAASSSAPTSSAAGSSGATASIAQCGDSSFTVSAANQQGATGHSSVVLRFRNTSSLSCTVRGYPGVDALTSTGGVLVHATRTLSGFAGGARTIATLTVAPGATVSAVLEWMNFNPTTTGACATSAAIAVTPANTTRTVRLPVHVTACVLQIHPTVAGATGGQ